MLSWHFIKEYKNNFIDSSGQFIFVIQSGLTEINKEKYGKSHEVSKIRSNTINLIISGFTHLSDPGCEKLKVIIDIDRL